MMYYKRNTFRGEKNMKPRIFVSSTFYDLKYIREDLSNFIKAHDFEPILFEDGDIGYVPGKALDISCYGAMKNTDMVLLIIGGQYGSPSTGEVKDEFKEYISVTRNEFKKAVTDGIPIYVFVDSKVYTEFSVYEANYEKIEVNKEKINFRNVKDINVFRFIREIKGIGHISITEFEKVLQIKDFLSKQWSDMFKQYLDYLKEKENDKKIENTVDGMKILIRKMEVMLNEVGKKILVDGNNNEYNDVMKRQEVITVSEKISNCFELAINEKADKDSKENRVTYIRRFLDALYESLESDVWTNLDLNNRETMLQFFLFFKNRNLIIYQATDDFYKDADDFKSIMENVEEKELLINELIKNEYYEQIRHKLVEDEVNKIKKIE